MIGTKALTKWRLIWRCVNPADWQMTNAEREEHTTLDARSNFRR